MLLSSFCCRAFLTSCSLIFSVYVYVVCVSVWCVDHNLHVLFAILFNFIFQFFSNLAFYFFHKRLTSKKIQQYYVTPKNLCEAIRWLGACSHIGCCCCSFCRCCFSFHLERTFWGWWAGLNIHESKERKHQTLQAYFYHHGVHTNVLLFRNRERKVKDP